MKILLPPSEGKTPPASGDPLDFAALTSPELTAQRKQVLGTLKEVSQRDDALTALGVGATLTEEVARNVRIDTEPCAPALLTYTGVLYEAMGAADLVAEAGLDAGLAARLRDVHVFSAVFGQVGGLDPIPAYRLAMKTDLGGLGRLSSWWKPILAKSFAVHADEVILDCRSSDYRAVWPGPHEQVVTLGAIKITGDKRSVVSHWAKFYRGELVGRLLRDERGLPGTIDELVTRAGAHYEVEFTAPTTTRPAGLTIVLRD